MNNIDKEISRIERSHDYLWSVRQDLHTRFDERIKPHMVDSVLDAAASGYEGRINRFRKIFIEKSAVRDLEALAGSRVDMALASVIAAYGVRAA
ncbi:hypothetical protein [Corynebacterium pacaense]|uniref:hypothetical protein n=1 Tax=Corynebacterium pacaense TaxID=1816684 RepID=UPI0009B9ED40|nr:hypothetical protein [Corynebacterium pacaense]